MEVASAEDFGAPVVDEDQRVVGGGDDLALEDLPRPAQGVPAGAVHLGHAAQRVRVLDLLAVAMALHDRAVGQEEAEVGGALSLPELHRRHVVVDGGWTPT